MFDRTKKPSSSVVPPQAESWFGTSSWSQQPEEPQLEMLPQQPQSNNPKAQKPPTAEDLLTRLAEAAEAKEQKQPEGSLKESDEQTSCSAPVEIPLEITDVHPSESSKNQEEKEHNSGNLEEREDATGNEGSLDLSKTKASRQGNAGTLTIFCQRARERTFVYGDIKTRYNPIISWFLEVALSDGTNVVLAAAVTPRSRVKFNIIHGKPISWAQVKTAWAKGLVGIMAMENSGKPLLTSCPSSKDDEGGQ
jgi:hypothetical protein